jgi:ATP synthase protein I
MSTDNEPAPKEELRDILRRDLERHAGRERGQRTFWRSLSLIGAVGWSIAVPSVGGALLGHYLDRRWGTGVRFALLLMTVGVLAGSMAAWRIIGRYRP